MFACNVLAGRQVRKSHVFNARTWLVVVPPRHLIAILRNDFGVRLDDRTRGEETPIILGTAAAAAAVLPPLPSPLS